MSGPFEAMQLQCALRDCVETLALIAEAADADPSKPCSHEELCHRDVCQETGCIVERVQRGRAALAAEESAPSADPPVTLETVTALKALADAAVEFWAELERNPGCDPIKHHWPDLFDRRQALYTAARAYARSVEETK